MKFKSHMQQGVSTEEAIMAAYMDDIKRGGESMVNDCLPLVISIAKKYHSDFLSLSDLINEGNIGLLSAAERYTPDCGKPFTAIAAYDIRMAIEDAIKSVGEEIKIKQEEALESSDDDPYSMAENKSNQQTVRNTLTTLPERERLVVSHLYGIAGAEIMTMQEIGDTYGMKRERVRQVRDSAFRKLRHFKKAFSI